MNNEQLIGKVAALYLHAYIAEPEQDGPSSSLARFVLNQLRPERMAQIVKAILNDPLLRERVIIKVPKAELGTFDLPERVLTDESAVHWRNTTFSDPQIKILLIANVNKDQAHSLGTLSQLGVSELKSNPGLWIKACGLEGKLNEEERQGLYAALKATALLSSNLTDFSRYVDSVSEQIEAVGLANALEYALPELQLPRESELLKKVPNKKYGQVAAWIKQYKTISKKYGGYLLKELPSGEVIERRKLDDKFKQLVLNRVLDDEQEKVMKAFIASPQGWNEQARALAELKWADAYQLFEKLKKTREKLGEKTLRFFEDDHADEIDEDERELLFQLDQKKLTTAEEEETEFYQKYAKTLAENPLLSKEWDKLVFGQSKEYEDFLIGLSSTFERLLNRCPDHNKKYRLALRVNRGGKKMSFWRNKNANALRYFILAYRGFDTLFGDNFHADLGHLFVRVFDDLKCNSSSTAKAALSIEFALELIDKETQAVAATCQFIWKSNAAGIGLGLSKNIKTLTEKSLWQSGRVFCEDDSSFDGRGEIDLSNLNSIRDVEGGSDGIFIDPTGEMSINTSDQWLDGLAQLKQERLLTEAQTEHLKTLFEAFRTVYFEALKNWVTFDKEDPLPGLASHAFEQLSTHYQALLAEVSRCIRSDRLHELLGSYLLNLGAVHVDKCVDETWIIPPWHPLKMIEQRVKIEQIGKEFEQILTAGTEQFVDSKLYFNDLVQALTNHTISEIMLSPSRELLVNAYSYQGYDLLSQVAAGEGVMATTNNDGAINHLLDTTDRYLALLPHERNNFSILLYDNLQPSLTTKIIEGLFQKTDAKALNCDLHIYQNDREKVRTLYQNQNELAEKDQNMRFSGEATKQFIAPLRVSMLETLSYRPSAKSAHYDLVLVNQVFARASTIKWVSLLSGATHNKHWRINSISRKKPIARGDRQKLLYLCDPALSGLQKTCLEIIYSGHTSDYTKRSLIPAYVINYADPALKKAIQDSHQYGEWVVCFDKLMDRDLMKNCDVKVVRHSHDRLSRQNCLVSTGRRKELLTTMIAATLKKLNMPVEPATIEKIQSDACALSGHLLMKAAKQGVFTKELIGVVLSMALIRSHVDQETDIGWYSLDEYASWFGVSEQGIADILAMIPVMINGKRVLRIIIAESKFVSGELVEDHAKKSANQLRATISRISDSLNNRDNIDQNRWMQRIADMMLDNLSDSTNIQDVGVEQWANAVRNDDIEVEVIGQSHVFVYDQTININPRKVTLASHSNCTQEIFSKTIVQHLLNKYSEPEGIRAIRKQTMGDDEWWLPRTESETPEPVSMPPMEKTVAPAPTKAEPTETKIATEIDEPLAPSAASDLPLNHDPRLNWLPASIAAWAAPQITKNQASQNDAQDWLVTVEKDLRKALRAYQMTAEILEARLTPNAGLFRLKGSSQLTISSVEKQRSVLKTSHGIDILSLTAGLGEIVIAVRRPKRALLDLVNLWQDRKVNRQDGGTNLSLLIGAKESNGEPLYLNIDGTFADQEQHAPHTLIAGGTGSGKSVLVQNLIIDLCLTNNPKDIEIHLIDPKMGVDYPWTDELPHIKDGIITDKSSSASILESLANEMDERYRLFKMEKARDLRSYNQKVTKKQRRPYVWIVHDEFADWMIDQDYKKTVSSTVNRLGIKARAAGIYLIFIAQRPDNEVFPMQLRNNLGNRLILRVADDKTSTIALNTVGAEKLLGKGHLAAKLENEKETVIYAQVPFMDSEPLDQLAALIKRHYAN